MGTMDGEFDVLLASLVDAETVDSASEAAYTTNHAMGGGRLEHPTWRN